MRENTYLINMIMKKIILLLIVAICSAGAKMQADIPYTELNYNVHYHWGVIDVMIGHGVLTVQEEGGNFTGTLDGNSIPWNGRVFCISDTIRANVTPTSETVEYVNGWYMKPKVTVYRSNSFNPANPANYKNIKGEGTLNADADTMEAVSIMANMTSLCYYFKEIDFASMSEGAQVAIPISGPDGNEKVVITYKGKSTVKADNIDYHAYSVEFEYTYHGSPSGYTVSADVAADSRIPLRFAASLPIGRVMMEYHE